MMSTPMTTAKPPVRKSWKEVTMKTEKGSCLIGGGSVRSEDAVFSDADAEFSDSGSGVRTGEELGDVSKSATSAERVGKNDLNAREINENTTNWLESQGSVSTASIDLMKRSESVVQDDKNGSEVGLHPIKYEMLTHVTEDRKKTHATDSVIESSLTSISQESQVKEIEASDMDRNSPYALTTPNQVSSETANLE